MSLEHDSSLPLLTAEEMRGLDRTAIEDRGIPGVVLMENAGRGCAEVVLDLLDEIGGERVAVFCGAGNNGGDGFVIARHLRNRGVGVDVFLLAPAEKITGDAKTNLDILLQGPEDPPIPLLSADDLNRQETRLRSTDLVVDAILGTGLQREVSGLFLQVIEELNELGCPLVAVDIPSGLCSDAGQPLGWAVRATATVTFGCLKRGQVIHPGADFCGDLYLADIGMPADLVTAGEYPVRLLGADEVRALLPDRPADGHKGNFGHCLVVAGRTGFTGAAALCGQGVLHSGAALATLAAADRPLAAAMAHAPELMGHPLALDDSGAPSGAALAGLLAAATEVDVLAVGPGLGDTQGTRRLVEKLLRESSTPLVLDADALNALAGDVGLLAGAEVPVVITPHPGEMARLLGCATTEVQADRIEVARRFAGEHGVQVVLKGARTVCAEPQGRCRVIATGNHGLATAGSGDVLTGVIAGLLAQGVEPADAGPLGAYLHGLAGDLAAAERSARSMVARDVLDFLAEAFQALAEVEPE